MGCGASVQQDCTGAIEGYLSNPDNFHDAANAVQDLRNLIDKALAGQKTDSCVIDKAREKLQETLPDYINEQIQHGGVAELESDIKALQYDQSYRSIMTCEMVIAVEQAVVDKKRAIAESTNMKLREASDGKDMGALSLAALLVQAEQTEGVDTDLISQLQQELSTVLSRDLQQALDEADFKACDSLLGVAERRALSIDIALMQKVYSTFLTSFSATRLQSIITYTKGLNADPSFVTMAEARLKELKSKLPPGSGIVVEMVYDRNKRDGGPRAVGKVFPDVKSARNHFRSRCGGGFAVMLFDANAKALDYYGEKEGKKKGALCGKAHELAKSG